MATHFILGISPGTRYFSVVIFNRGDLIEYRIKYLKGKWSKTKLVKTAKYLSGVYDRYRFNLVLLRMPPDLYCNDHLKLIITEVQAFAEQHHITLIKYPHAKLENHLKNVNGQSKLSLTEKLFTLYPELNFKYLNRSMSDRREVLKISEAISVVLMYLKGINQ